MSYSGEVIHDLLFAVTMVVTCKLSVSRVSKRHFMHVAELTYVHTPISN